MMKPVVLLLLLAPLLTCCREEAKPVDCNDVFRQTHIISSGVYSIYPYSERFPIQAYCDMETDGGRWTVFQRRIDGTVNFYRGWDQYVGGFGDVSGEHWLGLDFIHRITAKRPQELLVEMEDFEGNKASARYSSFSVGGECDGYKLTVSGFTDGGAGDSLKIHNQMKFSTFDKDQDSWGDNCAKSYLGAFWYIGCHDANPNGAYLFGNNSHYATGVIWKMWKGHSYSLKSISFKTRSAR